MVKSSDTIPALKQKIHDQAEKQYSIKAIVSRYMDCIEEIINVPSLLEKFKESIDKGYLQDILGEIIEQSKIEFNYEDDYDMSDYEDIDLSE